MTDNGYLWTFPNAIKASLSWHRRENNQAEVALVILNHDGSKPLPPQEMKNATIDNRHFPVTCESLDNDSVAAWAEENLKRYYSVKRSARIAANEKLIAEWDLSPKP